MSKQIEALKLAQEALQVAATPLARDRQTVLIAQTAIWKALAEPVADVAAAIKKLDHLGYTYHGGEFLKSPIGKRPAQPSQCWKCSDSDPTFQARCDVPNCEMRAQPAQPEQQPVLKHLLKKQKWILDNSFADVAGFDEEGSPLFYGKESVNKLKSGELSVPCKGKNCGSLNGWLHSAECRAEHDAQYLRCVLGAFKQLFKRLWMATGWGRRLDGDTYPLDATPTSPTARRCKMKLVRDQIIGMARAAGFEVDEAESITKPNTIRTSLHIELERFANAAYAAGMDAEANRQLDQGFVSIGHMSEQIAKERQTCIDICHGVGGAGDGHDCAHEINKRGEQ